MLLLFRVLADLTVVVHLAFVLFVVLGGFLVLRWGWIAWLHLPAMAWGIWIQLAGSFCPLTPLEIWLRVRGGGAGYEASFTEQYLLPILYPATLTRELQWMLAGALFLINVVAYALVLRGRRV
jgi:hypothetical protein